MSNRIGFMQGRLSPLIDGKIQAFPWPYWQQEFELALQNDLQLMEWTLDQDRLYENPLMTDAGQAEIEELSRRYSLEIPSLTGDCFMQAPFWKAQDDEREKLQDDFMAVAEACANVGIGIIIVPLVDNGRLENSAQEKVLIDFLESQIDFFDENYLRIAFESDFVPNELSRFINRFDERWFGINYDIGNSAALGFDPNEEFDRYGDRIYNVHVKDRKLGGTTVPLGEGKANFKAVFSALADVGYSGNYILQTARVANDYHAKALCRYRDMVVKWVKQYGA